MKLITKYTDYAIKALCFAAKNSDKLFSVAELSEKLTIPRSILRNILQQLSKNKFMESFKGKGGGFKLIVPANQIYIADLIRVFQGPIQLNECVIQKNICPDINLCALKNKIDKIELYVVNEIKAITIQSLL